MNKIKILHVEEQIYSGGVERRRLLLARYLDKSMYQQKIICTSFKGPIATDIKNEGVEIIPIGEFSSVFDFKQYKKVIKIINEYQPDIIHGAVFEGVIMACVCGFIKKVPIIIAEETSDPQDRSRKADFLLRFLCMSADKVVAISPGTEDYLRKRAKIPTRKIQLINNGVNRPYLIDMHDLELFKNQIGINENDFIIGSVGRLHDDHKKFTDIIKAIALLKKQVNLKLLIVGDGQDKELILQTARQKGIANRLIMAGFQANTSPFYQSMDVFCIASQREGFGLVAAEAMFHKLPVIATAVGGLKSVVLDNETGFLVPPNNPEMIAQKLEILINNPDLRKKIGIAGFHRAKSEYAYDIYVNKVDAMYKELYRKNISKNNA